MITSPKVATYDLQPQMSALEVAEKLSERIAEGNFEFLMNNLAPPVSPAIQGNCALFWSLLLTPGV